MAQFPRRRPMNGSGPNNQVFSDPAVAILANRIETMHNDFSEMRKVLQELSGAITKLALIEERQAQTNGAQERVFKVLERLEQRVSSIERKVPDDIVQRIAELERRVPDNTRASLWIDRATWAAVVAVAAFLAKQTGLL